MSLIIKPEDAKKPLTPKQLMHVNRQKMEMGTFFIPDTRKKCLACLSKGDGSVGTGIDNGYGYCVNCGSSALVDAKSWSHKLKGYRLQESINHAVEVTKQ